LDYRALPAPVTAAGRHLPRTPEEKTLATIFAEILQLPEVSIDDNFFDLGGHSLQATTVVSRIRAELHVEIALRVFFENPTVAGVAGALAHGTSARPDVAVMSRPDLVRLSYGQQRLWFLNQLYDGMYSVPYRWRVEGELDLPALRAAVSDVLGRHESLRTVFPEYDGVPCQVTQPPTLDVAVEPYDDAAFADFVRRGFDLTTELPIRVRVFTSGPDEWVLAIVLHHIACDGWSRTPFLRDLGLAYSARHAGRSPDWTPLPVQYADFALWQRELLGEESDPESLMARQLAYWREALAGLPDSLNLPFDRPRPEVASFAGGSVTFGWSADLHDAVVRVARDAGASLFMVIQAGFAVLLNRLGAGTDIPLGTAIAGRLDEALHEVVGFFINSLVVRVDLSGEPTFRTLLDRVRATALAGFDNQDVPFERLVEALNPRRSLARHPLFQVMLTFNDAAPATLELPDLELTNEIVYTEVAKFDLSVKVWQTARDDGRTGLDGLVLFATDLFDTETVARMMRQWEQVLWVLVTAPDRPIGEIDPLDHDRAGGPTTPAPPVPRQEPADRAPRPPRTPRERVVARIFADILDLPAVGIDDHFFFDLGGHSLLAARLISRIRAVLHTDISLRTFFEEPTVVGVTRALRDGGRADDFSPMLVLREPAVGQPSLFCIHPIAGIGWTYAALSRYVPPSYGIRALQSPSLTTSDGEPASFTALADDYLSRIVRAQPAGPYLLLGWSFGGLMAHTLATRLRARGEHVGLLALLDSFPPGPRGVSPGVDSLTPAIEGALAEVGAVFDAESVERRTIWRAAVLNHRLLRTYVPESYRGDVLLFQASTRATGPSVARWRPHVDGAIDVHVVPSDHHHMLGRDAVATIGPILLSRLTRMLQPIRGD
jgi:thioesterase domain-containing protein/acyl carrier protein